MDRMEGVRMFGCERRRKSADRPAPPQKCDSAAEARTGEDETAFGAQRLSRTRGNGGANETFGGFRGHVHLHMGVVVHSQRICSLDKDTCLDLWGPGRRGEGGGTRRAASAPAPLVNAVQNF